MPEDPENRSRSEKATEDLRAAADKAEGERYVLRLYVAGMTPRSAQAIRRAGAFCAEHLDGRYDLEVVDIYQTPALARDEQIIAVPTLIRRLPLPLRRIIGDLQDEDALLFGLDLKLRKDESAQRHE